MRAPGMTMFRLPIFTWNILVTSILVLIVFPILAAALLVLEADRSLGRARLRRGHRRRHAVAAPVLVLRPSRGVHHRVAVLRHHHRGAAGVQQEADLRLHRPGRRHLVDRGPVGRGVGSPHVRHRRGQPAVLLLHDVPDRRPDRGEVLQLDRHDVGRQHHDGHAHALGRRLLDHLPLRWPDRRRPGQPAAGLRAVGLLLRGRPLPLRRLRHRGVRHVRRLLLLVAEVHRADARRDARQDPLLAAVHRLPHHVPGPALAGRRGHAAALRRLPAERGFHDPQPGLLGRCVPARGVDDSVHLERLEEPQVPDWSTPTTRGAGVGRWSGRRRCPPPRHNFTSLPRIRSESPAFDLHHPEVALLEYDDNRHR